MENEDTNRVDAVYTWVNCEDPQWQMEFNRYRRDIVSSASGCHNSRFRDNGEIFYSLLSLERFAPWINKIFIVKRSYQSPCLGQLSNETKNKIVFIDVATLKPPDISHEEFYPTFNSQAIEPNLHRIPGLSEKFIYFNDDVFLGRPLTPEYFFPDNKAKYAVNNYSIIFKAFLAIARSTFRKFIKNHPRHLINSYQIFNREITSAKKLNMSIVDHHIHQCCPLLVSSYKYLWSNAEIRKQLLLNSASRFRKDTNLHSAFLVCLTNLYLGNALVCKEDDETVSIDNNIKKSLRRIKIKRPARFCINDGLYNKNYSNNIKVVNEFFEEYFDNKRL